MEWLVTTAAAEAALAGAARPFAELMRHGSMSVELYAPQGKDLQTPHAQDELYLVRSGSGVFLKPANESRFSKATGSSLKRGLSTASRASRRISRPG